MCAVERVGRIVSSLGDEWSAPDTETAELLAAARTAARSPEAVALLSRADPAGDLRLEDGSASSVAVCLRVGIGIVCSKLHALPRLGAEARAQRDRLYALDQLLQPLIAPGRGQYPTFPSRRHHDQLTARGIAPAAVAQLIGLPLAEAQAEAGELGLHVSTAHMLMNRDARQLDVIADDGHVTNILGLHVD